MWKRILLVVLLLAFIGGGYRVMPAGIAIPFWKQAPAEQQSTPPAQTSSSDLMDLDISLLEQASQTAPHDRRLALLLVRLLQQAAADRELRPLLVEALNQALKEQGSPAKPENAGTDPHPRTRP